MRCEERKDIPDREGHVQRPWGWRSLVSWRDSPKVKVMGAQRYSAQDHEGEPQVYARVGLAGPRRPGLCDILCVGGAGGEKL